MKNSIKKGTIIIIIIVFIFSLIMSSTLFIASSLLNNNNEFGNALFKWPENIYNSDFDDAIDSYDGNIVDVDIFTDNFIREFKIKINNYNNVNIADFKFKLKSNSEFEMKVTKKNEPLSNKDKLYYYVIR